MKRNSLTVLVGVLLLLIFVLLLFTFQVRQTEIALVTTFNKPSRYITEPGFNWKWPPPIQSVIKFDKRVQTLDQDKIEQTLTRDGFLMVVQVYLGWTISQPELFFSSFPAGTVAAAQPALDDLVRGAKNSIIPQHPLSHFVSTDPKQLQFTQIEKEMLDYVSPIALKNYGVQAKFLGIKKLGLPESVTQKVFDRMMQERRKEQSSLDSQGLAAANKIRAEADTKKAEILAKANSEATAIKGQADSDSASLYEVFNQNEYLARLILQLHALEDIGKEKTTYFLDARTSPFSLLTSNFWDHSSSNTSSNLTTNPPMEKATASKDLP